MKNTHNTPEQNEDFRKAWDATNARWKAQNKPYRLLQDNGSKYFGESWDKAEQPAPKENT